MFNLFNRKSKKVLVACERFIELNDQMIAELEKFQEDFCNANEDFKKACGDSK